MFSIHIDTARTWRGGQHPDGELRRRVAEGLDLIPLAPRAEMDLSAAWKLSRLLKRLAPDVIHAHDPHGVAMASLALSLGGAARGAARPPALVAARRVDFHLKGNSLSRWKYRQVDCFIAASEAIRRMLLSDGVPADRTVTVHEGIDVDHVQSAPAVNVHEAFWLPHRAPVVGNVAALVPHKGQRYLIDAARIVVREIPDARFVILGEGELRDHLEKQVHEYHLEKHVLLPGFRTDVLGCIKGFDVFAMSSVTEGLGTSLLDAMACRRAIVATSAGGIPELVEDGVNGLVVPPRDAPALARAIVRALEDNALRQRMADAGFARVCERFTVERMVAGTADAYDLITSRVKLDAHEET
jgi:glycosyltransferase involved in cell wall biosynthesis